ncbi:MAG: YraN family protein [Candidatus Delongbacteria bacterium]
MARRPGAAQQGMLDGMECCRRRGQRGEDLAADWLEARGFRILKRNLRRRQAGEVDLLAERDGVLHVVEVKCGRGPLELLLERVDERKLRLLLKTLARSGWLEGGPGRPTHCRVDVLLVQLDPQGPQLHFLEDLCPPELRWEGGADV